MSVAAIGSGIVSTGELPEYEGPVEPIYDISSLPPEPQPTPETTPDDEKPYAPQPPAAMEMFIKAGETFMPDEFRAMIHAEMAAYVADAERRLAQAREIENAVFSGVPRETVHAEDLNIGKHLIDGYNLTANSPVAGSIAWSNLHVVLLGVDYTITDGNTANKYAWFVKPGSGTTVTLTTGNTMPVLGSQDALIFVNNGGTPVSVLESSITYAVAQGVIGNAQLDSTTQTLLSTLQANDIAMQGRIDGVITSYYQDNAPWPSGSPSPSGGDVNMGDIWYDSNDGGAFRWTGTSGTPTPNTWQRIADTDTSAIAAKVNTKTSTYLSALASPPAAPSGGFTVGDFWMVTDQGNLIKRWSGSAWVDLQIGDAGIASGISGAKIGSGINASNLTTGTVNGALVGTGVSGTNITTGTVAAARVGAGVAGAVLSSATGQVATSQIANGAVGATQLASSAVTPAKINAAFHILY